jgi:hypothetical protein
MKFLVYMIVCLQSYSLLASEMEDVFKRRFYSNYKAGQCLANSKSFIAALNKLELDLNSHWYITVDAKGLGLEGLVNAENARDLDANNEITSVDKNLKLHAFVADDQLNVYDFDFGSFPLVLPIEEYLFQMFLDEDDDIDDALMFRSMEDKFFDYRLNWHRVVQTSTGELRYITVKVQTFNDFLLSPSIPE